MMRNLLVTIATICLGSFAAQAASLAPVRIILVGDSTMAPVSGYGNSFCAQWQPNVTCINDGLGGRSTKSYRAEGAWDNKVMHELANTNAPDGRPYAKTYVLMQFAHNDASNWPERHVDVQDFPEYLTDYAHEAKATGATFILVTPLTVRNFVNGKLQPGNIAPYSEAMKNTAASEHLPLLDLYGESQKSVQAMGIVKANHQLAGQPIPQNILDTENTGNTLSPQFDNMPVQPGVQAFDYVHLNQTTGGLFFGTMVTDLLIKAEPELAAYRK